MLKKRIKPTKKGPKMANGKNGGERTLLLLQSSFNQSNNLEYAAIFKRARELRFQVQVVQYGKAAFNRFQTGGRFRGAWLQETLDFWKPDGCIVESGTYDMMLDPDAFNGIPTVFLDRHPSTLGKNAVSVSSDCASVVADAARELLRLQLPHYAYFSFHRETAWNVERRGEFERLMKRNGVHPLVCGVRAQGSKCVPDFAEEVSSLPRPCGVLAANDFVAEQVVCACVKAGIAVPDEIAVVGVDNDEQVCENAAVPISSVRQDFSAAGTLSVDLLAEMVEHPRRRVKSRRFASGGLVRRASTLMPCGDARIRKALEFIRLHACERISVPDVVRAMACSRRLADLRFGQLVGHSIAEEIVQTRIAHACELLKKGNPSGGILAGQCGFSSDIVFRRSFKAITGRTPLQWKYANGVA